MTAVLLPFVLVSVAPGPANLAVALLAMGRGRAVAPRMALGLALGLAFWGMLAAFGLGAVLAASERGMTALRILGGAYLLWLAWTGWCGAGVAVDVPAVRRPFRTGLLLDLSNPKAVFAWLAVLAMGLDPDAGTGAVVLAVVICAGIGLTNCAFWAVLMSGGPVHRFYLRGRRWIETAAAAPFGLAGAELIRQGAIR